MTDRPEDELQRLSWDATTGLCRFCGDHREGKHYPDCIVLQVSALTTERDRAEANAANMLAKNGLLRTERDRLQREADHFTKSYHAAWTEVERLREALASEHLGEGSEDLHHEPPCPVCDILSPPPPEQPATCPTCGSDDILVFIEPCNGEYEFDAWHRHAHPPEQPASPPRPSHGILRVPPPEQPVCPTCEQAVWMKSTPAGAILANGCIDPWHTEQPGDDE